MRVLNVQGRKKTGKTTTVTNIISELVRRGYSVGSVKGIHIEGFTMDAPGEDTDKHKKAGADPVTARCHDETNIMFREKMDLKEILKHYDNDWVVIESHVDLNCPNIITGRTAEYDGEGKDVSLAEQINERTIACSGVISNEIDEFRGLPVINSMTDAAKLVDIIEGYVSPLETTIQSPDEDFELVETNTFTKVDADGTRAESSDHMLMENTIQVYVDDRFAGSIPHTPQYIAELVIGWLNDEGYIDSITDVERLDISAGGSEARVKRKWQAGKAGTAPVQPIPWNKEWIFELAEDFEKQLPLRQQTMAAHNCRLARGTAEGAEILFKCEDIGRHSAIDKAIGWAMRNGVDTRDCILFTAGSAARWCTKSSAPGSRSWQAKAPYPVRRQNWQKKIT